MKDQREHAEHALSTRDRLIETTCELLELQGYHATGLNQILSDSDTPKGSLYHHFPRGKEELTIAAIAQVGTTVLERIRAQLAPDGDRATSRVPEFIRGIAYNVERSGFRMGGPITTVALEAAASSERIRRECARIYQSWQKAVAHAFSADGYTEHEAEQVATSIIARIEGGIIMARCERSRRPLDAIADELERSLALREEEKSL
ncbi:MAG: TetR/AcrR family transcriptional regulator [Spirochaetales bacterium]